MFCTSQVDSEVLSKIPKFRMEFAGILSIPDKLVRELLR